MKKIDLIIEKANNGKYWGRVKYEGNLIIDSAKTIPILVRKMNNLLKYFHRVTEIEYKYAFDVCSFFKNFDYLNKTKIAHLSNINPALVRQYAAGLKYPSMAQAKKIELAVHKLAKELSEITFVGN